MSATSSETDWIALSQPVGAAPAPSRFDLEAALRLQQIEFWYQPKIDLRKKRLVGVEAFARLCDGEGNFAPASELIACAPVRSVAALTERALISALQTSENLLEMGVEVRLAINVNIAALTRLPIPEIVQKHRPRYSRPVSLIFDVTEEDVLANFEKMRTVSRDLDEAGFSIAVDDFGAALLSIGQQEEACEKVAKTFNAIKQFGNVKFAEMKIDRTLVRGCSESADRQRVCGHIIKLAHAFGSTAVAVGIESVGDLRVLESLGCDIGQGYLFGPPMSEEEFLMLLWDRSVRAKEQRQAIS